MAIINSKHMEYLEKHIKIDKNKEHAKNFLTINTASGIGEKRLKKYLDVLHFIENIMKKDIKTATKEDMINLLAVLNSGKSSKGTPYSQWTKYTFIRVIQKFYQWAWSEEEYKDKVSWIKAKRQNASIVTPESLIEESEFQRMLKSSKHPRDKAILMTLYEMGLRSDELRSAKIKNIEMNGTLARLRVEGKTGSRRVMLIKSYPFISNWLTAHPDSDNPEAFIFPALSTRNHMKKLSSAGLNRIIKNSAQNAGVKRRVYPHLLRHVSATNMSRDLSEMELRELYGWSKSSTNITSTYLHVSQKRLESRLMEVNGLKKAKEENDSMLPKNCYRCGHSNPFDADHCSKCHMPFNIRDGLDNKAKWDRIGDVMTILSNLPQFQEAISIAVREMKCKE